MIADTTLRVKHIMTREEHDEHCAFHKDYIGSCDCGAEK